MSQLHAHAVTSPSRRNIAIAGGVLLFHAAALWALQTGLIRRAVEVFVPVEVLSEIITPVAPKVEPAAPAPKPPEPVKREPQPVKKAAAPAPTPAPQPLAVATPAPPAPDAPTGVAAPQPPAPAVAAPVAPAPAAPPKVELPSSEADYLRNPPPPYPPMSRRQNEEGQVMVRVTIAADGTIRGEPTIARSSGYDRLDRAAIEAVRKWRFVPGKRNGVAVEMTYEAPVIFKLDR